MNRKRSSRIATRELEREEEIRRKQANREMEERMDQSRREEARAARDETELISRERAREERLKEREERAVAREEAVLKQHMADKHVKSARDQRQQSGEGEGTRSDSSSEDDVPRNGKTNGAVTPRNTVGEAKSNGGVRWELNCEICRKNGWNLVSSMTISWRLEVKC